MVKKTASMACLIGSLFLGGCAVPILFTNIGYIKTGIDIVSYVATNKGTTDHAISAYTNKDCALHRLITEKDNKICRLAKKQEEAKLAKEFAKYDLIIAKEQLSSGFENNTGLIPQLAKDYEKNIRILKELSTEGNNPIIP